MEIEKVTLLCQQTLDRAKSNTHRIERLEGQSEAIGELARSIAVMAERLSVLNRTVGLLDAKVEKIEALPAKKWERVCLKALEVIAAAAVGFILAHFGL